MTFVWMLACKTTSLGVGVRRCISRIHSGDVSTIHSGDAIHSDDGNTGDRTCTSLIVHGQIASRLSPGPGSPAHAGGRRRLRKEKLAVEELFAQLWIFDSTWMAQSPKTRPQQPELRAIPTDRLRVPYRSTSSSPQINEFGTKEVKTKNPVDHISSAAGQV